MRGPTQHEPHRRAPSNRLVENSPIARKSGIQAQVFIDRNARGGEPSAGHLQRNRGTDRHSDSCFLEFHSERTLRLLRSLENQVRIVVDAGGDGVGFVGGVFDGDVALDDDAGVEADFAFDPEGLAAFERGDAAAMAASRPSTSL